MSKDSRKGESGRSARRRAKRNDGRKVIHVDGRKVVIDTGADMPTYSIH